ncbi:MAG: glycine cleavage system protein H, partial [Nitrososphaerota archaeon]|nr:glycine cleavage system protein H [Nitrososphaerota archaeon]
MQVLNCEFPDDIYYDVENDTWFKVVGDGGRIGITSALSFLAGRILRIKLKTDLDAVSVGKSLGTIESAVYFGAIRSPVTGKLSSLNLKLQDR